MEPSNPSDFCALQLISREHHSIEGKVINSVSKFVESKQMFDDSIGRNPTLPQSLVPVDGKIKENIDLRSVKGAFNEEYYKWEFLFALIHSGLYSKDYIGTEVRFPKGNKSSKPLKLDAAIFDDPAWLNHYVDYWTDRRSEDLEWLNAHLLAVIEFKKDDKDISGAYSGQVKPAMKEKDPAIAYVLGIYYDGKSLFLFHRRNGYFLRYDEAKNQKGIQSKATDLSLNLPDPFYFIPSFDELRTRTNRPAMFDITNRSIVDLDVITSIVTTQLQNALSNVLRALDKVGLANQRGYEILIQTFALKIFDEKRNEKQSNHKLQFYVADRELNFGDLSDDAIQRFILRMRTIMEAAEGQYQQILSNKAIDWQNPNHVRAVTAICSGFQDFSFVRSSKSDLYQLVFYNFANAFTRDESAQFLTPLPVIDFIVKIVNPRNGESLIDPCCGIGDFLSLSYVNSQNKDSWRLDDANIFGVDLDENMIMLARLNMLLNGDGEAKLFQRSDKGSILSKVAVGNPPTLVDLIPSRHKAGNWDDWPDRTKLMKFDVVLTNPPFGEDRAYRARTDFDRQVIEMYELWGVSGESDSVDLGVVFLENAYRSLKPEGRLGIVVSNSIASIDKWRAVREWFMSKMRIVALFDLPQNVFAETGNFTSIIVAYKPKTDDDLATLNRLGYSVFVADIHHVGYERRTSKRNVFFKPRFEIDEHTFAIKTDSEGNPVLKEDFSKTVDDFRQWTFLQEKAVRHLFVGED